MPPAPSYKTATLPNGVQLAYIDSWAGRASRPEAYTTILALHGGGVNSAAWTPVLPYLPDNVRLLAYNQRSYAGSSPALDFAKQDGTDATAAYLGDLADFVDFAVDRLGVPAVGEGGKGGIVLLAWSKATTLTIALLSATQPPSPTAFTSSLPPNFMVSQPSLSTHLHSVILFEPGTPNLGLPPPPSFLAALGPAFATPPSADDPFPQATAMGQYVAGYREGADTATLQASSIEAVQAIVGDEVWEPAAIATAHWGLATTAEETGRMAKEALTAAEVPIGVVYGTESVDFCRQGGEVLAGWWEEARKQGKGGKRAVRAVEGMNHVGQVLMPGEFTAAVLGLIGELQA